MSLYPELPTAFPWYEKHEHQNRYIESVQDSTDLGLISPNNALLPFEIYKAPAAGHVNVLFIYRATDGVLVASITDLSVIRKTTKAGRDYFYYNGQALTTGGGALLLPCGTYEAHIQLMDGKVFYSEVFQVPGKSFAVGATADFVKIEWWNDTDIPPIFYNDLVNGKPYFTNVLYLDTFIKSSEPELTREGEVNGYDERVTTFWKTVINHTISEFGPDYLKKALMVAPMHDHIVITTKKGVRAGEVEELTVSSTTEDDGAFSSIEISWKDTVIIKKGCGENMV